MAKKGHIEHLVYKLVELNQIKKQNANYKRNKNNTIWEPYYNEISNRKQINENEHSGPVALLIQQLRTYDCNIDAKFVLTCHGEASYDLWNIPWQHLKTLCMDIVARHRTISINQKRTFCGVCDEIDLDINKYAKL